MRLAYLQDQITVGRHRLLLAGGYTDHDSFGGHATWNVEYAVEAGPDMSLWLAAGSAFRAPDATDRYGFGGNPALAPESSRSAELGFRRQAGPRHRFSLVAFRTEIDDLIQYVVTDYASFAGENRNVDRARIDGVELAWHYADGPWRARAALTLQDPRDLDTQTRLLRRAGESLTVSLSRSVGPHLLALDVLAAGKRRDFGQPSSATLDAYVVASLSARVALARHWTLTARLENLLDEQYELAQGYNTMDRSAFVALRYDFR
jgi:vitamin B12 transporter